MRFQQYLTEQRLEEAKKAMKEFIEMVHKYFSDFASDVKRLSHDFIDPWAAKIDVMKLKRQGWEIKRHSSNMQHELWVMAKGNEEKMLGY